MNKSKIFVGIPLSQFNNSNISLGTAAPLISEIVQFISEDQLTLSDLNKEKFNFKLDSTIHFFNWLLENKSLLLRKGFDFIHSYSEGHESPIIFGQYIDSNISDNNLRRYEPNAAEIENLSISFFDIIDTMHPDALSIIDENRLIGVFINEHTE